MGKFLKKEDMIQARKETEIFNARLKRGEVEQPKNILKSYHVVCGCGAPGCIFMNHVRSQPLEIK